MTELVASAFLIASWMMVFMGDFSKASWFLSLYLLGMRIVDRKKK